MSSDERLPESAVTPDTSTGEPAEVEETAADGAPLETDPAASDADAPAESTDEAQDEQPVAAASDEEDEPAAASDDAEDSSDVEADPSDVDEQVAEEVAEENGAEMAEQAAAAESEPEDSDDADEDEVAEEEDDAEASAEEGDEEEAEEEEVEEAPPEETRPWYVLKVQSNREKSIREAILRRLKIEGVEEYVTEIVIPTEKVSEIKDGKKRVVERRFFPGYIMVQLDLNDEVWFVIRETPGVGDFVGAGGRPVPMTDQDVARMLGRQEESEQAAPRLKINFQKGDRVKIKEGTFENFEGDVEEVNEQKGVVRVMIQIFNRPTPVELEYWQVEPV
ncbi:hypothetical protein Pan216_49160 [Planctomycetes bacterium Pan216]|uniref:Transcription termination/antitermination protein NusG n=1 Tax=Kolteria novifilia TaxID=2527975 RepID=A0A518BAM2_9BACT|nr:hypothetical protein Pan216_49160 [Planctomycetes bacterium Pan216]